MRKEKNDRPIDGMRIFRFACILALWIILCVWYVNRLIATDSEINLRTLLPILFSGIIIFVPLYKKYVKRNDTNNNQQSR